MYVRDIGDGFAVFMHWNTDTQCTCIHAPQPSKREDYFVLEGPHSVGLAIHHHAVRGGSFVNFPGLVKLQIDCRQDAHSIPNSLRLKGNQQPSNCPKSMTKLYPPHSNWTYQSNVEFRALQCLNFGNMWSSLFIGKFRCLHSSLMRAIRCANSEHSALSAGVPTDPHSPESNSSYLAQIWSIRELYSLCASYTVIKKTGLGMIRSDKYKFWVSNFNVGDIGDAKQVWSLWNIWVNWENCSFLPPNQLKLDNSGIQRSKG